MDSYSVNYTHFIKIFENGMFLNSFLLTICIDRLYYAVLV